MFSGRACGKIQLEGPREGGNGAGAQETELLKFSPWDGAVNFLSILSSVDGARQGGEAGGDGLPVGQ